LLNAEPMDYHIICKVCDGKSQQQKPEETPEIIEANLLPDDITQDRKEKILALMAHYIITLIFWQIAQTKLAIQEYFSTI